MKGTAALEKGIALLFEVAAANTKGATLTSLVESSGLPRSTVFRLVNCLVEQRILHKDSARRYHLGSNLYTLGALASYRYDFSDYNFAPLSRLAALLGDTVFLNRRVGLDMICVERVEGPHSVRVLTMSVGTRRPIGLGAGGIALLAAMEADEAEAILDANHARHVAYYGSSLASTLRGRMHIARRLGYAVNEGINTKGVTGIGVGIVSADLVPMLSLSMVATKQRISHIGSAAIAEELKKTSAEIALNLSRPSHKGASP